MAISLLGGVLLRLSLYNSVNQNGFQLKCTEADYTINQVKKLLRTIFFKYEYYSFTNIFLSIK